MLVPCYISQKDMKIILGMLLKEQFLKKIMMKWLLLEILRFIHFVNII
ncbi:GTP cyclohydrolase 1 [Candida albicans P57072]|uniref:GTP cyclohydrolase 1 n=1 Tax=Candida albicans P78048 TaxID=1094989 RepID=A0AB34PPF0_CANAX|nr:GTP cyclohydrolase 1 [Candida albicans P94015]KGQ86873.1 GTP cyclohydrolase 1 [Candida albicans P37005]KGQ90360.1 GTP cyclohydrolase 1 [Candida albicans GC75]KGR05902.1 GTP cyclohydrolase 1 [Candida albicans P57072]KGR07872.1 GTP cyclohydrolase 1 [Candida albicans P78048]KGR11326.1 GTP cyclohydrolase 1 [Candida albicans P37037]KGT67043.1 GTP cyclohydrolase 1 [Candida albicans 12C]KGU05226.1 GTP cyclohydrolase 1 [Candida albicans P87]KGU06412.1 GTP cyclohydrolase 1 [Candida albicans 19F]